MSASANSTLSLVRKIRISLLDRLDRGQDHEDSNACVLIRGAAGSGGKDNAELALVADTDGGLGDNDCFLGETLRWGVSCT